MSVTRTTAKKHPAPPASATVARLGGYLAAGLGAGVLGTSQADAEIVTIDIGPTGFNIGGPNANLATNSFSISLDFPFSGAGTLRLLNAYEINIEGDVVTETGLFGYSNLKFANGGGMANPTNFAAGATIDGSSTFLPGPPFQFSPGLFFYQINSNTPQISPDFGPGSYMGFRTAQGNYGWLEVTWSSSSNTFQIYSGAYESVVGVGIKAGDTAPVPEIDPNSFGSALSLVMGSLAVLEHRRRKRTEGDSASAVA